MNEVDQYLTRHVRKGHSPSVQYAIFHKDHIIHSFSTGQADILSQRQVDDRTTYNAYSVTKTFTAIAILQLAEKKWLDLDHSAKQYLPDFPYPAEITIRQLLSHSAGIPNPIPLNWIHLAEQHADFSWNEFFRPVFANNKKVRSGPNEKFSYSNLGYILLGQLIEKVAGITYEQYISENIIGVLGLGKHELGFTIPDMGAHAKGYHRQLSISSLLLSFFIDKSVYMGKPEGKWKPFKPFYVNGTPYGGLIGTPGAFVKYIQALMEPDGKLITEGSKQILFRENFTNANKPTGMCLSWYCGQLKGHRYHTHAGGGGGYYVEIRIYRDAGIGSVIMFNRTGMTDERFLDRLDGHFLPAQ